METKNRLNKYSQSVLTTDEAVRLLLNGGRIDGINLSDVAEREIYNSNAAQVLKRECELKEPEFTGSVEDFHKEKISTWNIPEEYLCINIESYLLERCHSEESVGRAMVELKMYEERGLLDVLRALIFLVEHFRKNDIVWGVGRGSSVSSYILYLIGVHKIDSLKYKLDIEEFLR